MNSIKLLIALALCAVLSTILFPSTLYEARFYVFGFALLEGILPVCITFFYFIRTVSIKSLRQFYKENLIYCILSVYVLISLFFNWNSRTLVTFSYFVLMSMFALIAYSEARSPGFEATLDRVSSLIIKLAGLMLIVESIYFIYKGWGEVAYESIVLQDKTSGSYFYAFLSVLVLWSYSHSKSRISLLIYFGTLFYAFICGSRTALFTVAFLSVILIRYKLGRKLTSVTAGVCIAFLMLFFLPVVGSQLKFVVFEKLVADGRVSIYPTGREVLIPEILEHALPGQPFGYGLGSAESFVLDAFNYKIGNTHSQYLSAFHDLGIFGLVLYILSILTWLTRIIGKRTLIVDHSLRHFYLIGGSFAFSLLLISIVDNVWMYYLFITNFVFTSLGYSLGLWSRIHSTQLKGRLIRLRSRTRPWPCMNA